MTAYRRRIRLESTPGRVDGELEDDFHHFRVALTHDTTRVTACDGEAIRFPWTACATSPQPLRAVAGALLSNRPAVLRAHADPHLNCTHLYDLTGLAITHALRPLGVREIDIVVPDREDERTRPILSVDGTPVLEWDVDGRKITGPAPFAGVSLRGSFIAWADATLEPEVAEAAIALRRACDIAMGRLFDLDGYARAIDVGEYMLGSCHSYQPGVAEIALRVRGSTRTW